MVDGLIDHNLDLDQLNSHRHLILKLSNLMRLVLNAICQLFSLMDFIKCRYVETIKGRKRFLSKIQSGNKKEKAKAERQAVNSICQVEICCEPFFI